ncbi:U7-hexatoxin-Hi1a-like [Pyxicephalus adspersus]|uniref:U7-hexatoxin-Hi1a-like n=1 Tax=Pyxicephalus adspersus TaxID=30357 RepID=UPI003B5C7CBE
MITGVTMSASIYLCLITALCLPSGFDSMMTGGWKDRDPKDPEIQKLASFAVDKYNQQSNYMYYFVLIDVISAESQVVNGAKYRITVKTGETNCRKNYSESNGKAQSCDPGNSQVNKRLQCTFTIIKYFDGKTELLKNSCS